MMDRTIRVVLQKRLRHTISLFFLPTNKSMPFQMTSTTRRLARVFRTTVFALSAIPDLLTIPLPADGHADSSGRRPLDASSGTSTSDSTIGASIITNSTTITETVDDSGDSANPLSPTSILL
jgi:hypothetical protein